MRVCNPYAQINLLTDRKSRTATAQWEFHRSYSAEINYDLVCAFIENLHNVIYNPGQNVLGHLRKLGTKTHFAKLTRILPLKKAWRCCYKGLFVLSPSPPSSVHVDCVELKFECITPTLHRGGRGEEDASI